MTSHIKYLMSRILYDRASVKLFALGVRTPGGLFLGIRYAGGVNFRHFCTPSLPIFGVILGLLKTTKMQDYTVCLKLLGIT